MSERQAGRSINVSTARSRVRVARNHQPPQRVAAFGRKAHRRRLEVQTGADDAFRVGEPAIWRSGIVGMLRRMFDPVEHRGRRPVVRVDADAVEHPRLRGFVARQRLDCGEFAYRQIGCRQRRPQVDPPLDEIGQPFDHRLQFVLAEFRSRPRCRSRARTRSSCRRRRRRRSRSTSADRCGRGTRAGAASSRSTCRHRAARRLSTDSVRGRCTDRTTCTRGRRRGDHRDAPVAKCRGRRARRLRRPDAPPRPMSGRSSCSSVAWNVRTGTAGMTRCETFEAVARANRSRLSRTRPTRAHSAPIGAVTFQTTSRAPPAAMSTRWGRRRRDERRRRFRRRRRPRSYDPSCCAA